MKNKGTSKFLFTLIISGAILVIILIAFLSEMKIASIKQEYEKIYSEQTKETESFSEETNGLKEEINILKEEKQKLSEELDLLKNKKGEVFSSGEKYNQAMKLLSDIYLLIESGNDERAKKELEKFDTSTFDDTVINYKKALEALIE